MWVIIVLPIILIICFFIYWKILKNYVDVEKEKLQFLENSYQKTQKLFSQTQQQICELQDEEEMKLKQVKHLEDTLHNLKLKEAEEKYKWDNWQMKANIAADTFEENLERRYQEKENHIQSAVAEAELELENIRADVLKMRETQHALTEARVRQQVIDANADDYCLSLDPIDEADIRTLEAIKPRLQKPRILSMLIWQTYFQKPLKSLCAKFGYIGKQGIYRITNRETGECYIGQSRDVSKRFAEHCKCGLGIDTPPKNKLYKSMMEYGLHIFTFELLKEVEDTSDLDEEEQYYIELYQSIEYGFNTSNVLQR